MKMIKFALLVSLLLAVSTGCAPAPTSNDAQRDRQNKVLDEAVAQTGLPAMTNFREFKMMKLIYELRDQEGLVTYTYVENLTPTVVPGYTAMGGKFTMFCDSIGYPISAAAQFTAPETVQTYNVGGGADSQKYYGTERLPQADPNGLFMPSSAEGSWALCNNPETKKAGVTYSESRLTAFPYKLPADK